MHFFINRVEIMESFPPFFSSNFLDHSYFIQAESLRDFPFAQRVSGIGRNCFFKCPDAHGDRVPNGSVQIKSDQLDHCSRLPLILRITLQGFPAARLSGGIFLVTTLPAPMTLPFPMVMPGRIMTPPPIQQPSSIVTGRA